MCHPFNPFRGLSRSPRRKSWCASRGVIALPLLREQRPRPVSPRCLGLGRQASVSTRWCKAVPHPDGRECGLVRGTVCRNFVAPEPDTDSNGPGGLSRFQARCELRRSVPLILVV
jgi:hypothetical protein